MKTNSIGLDKKKANQTATELNALLANYQLLYQNLRGYHWNIKGPQFFELHLKFEELYNDINLKVDQIAERILSLDNTPLHAFSDYLKKSEIKERSGLSKTEKILETLVEDYKTIVFLSRSILKAAENCSDEGTITLITENITQHEKTIWMLNAYKS